MCAACLQALLFGPGLVTLGLNSLMRLLHRRLKQHKEQQGAEVHILGWGNGEGGVVINLPIAF